jgi:pimeloyl-ACP methyl ester carboxylesterase
MKLVYKLGLVFGFAELVHQFFYWRRFTHFNNLRISNGESNDGFQTMIGALLDKNPNLFQRLGLYAQTSHILNEDDLRDALTTHYEERPVNKLQVGCSKLYWRYNPLMLELFMKSIRQIGNLYVRRILGYSRDWHLTSDGYYSVWTHTVKGTKPLLFFPGLGLGAILYAKFAKSLGRTVHIVEVPNIGYSTPLSDSQVTAKTLYGVVSKHVADGTDIFSHSFGSATAAMYLNMICDKPHPMHNVVVCDGFVDIKDTVVSHLYPFFDYSDYACLRKKPKSRLYYFFMLYCAMHGLEFQIWAKRYHNIYTDTLWREYPNTNLHYVYSKYDILYDTEFIAKNSDCTLLSKGGHGYSIFGIKDTSMYKKMLE